MGNYGVLTNMDTNWFDRCITLPISCGSFVSFFIRNQCTSFDVCNYRLIAKVGKSFTTKDLGIFFLIALSNNMRFNENVNIKYLLIRIEKMLQH